MKIFLVQELTYCYDDEFHHAPNQTSHDGEAGHPVKAFVRRENALEECESLNKERRKDPLEGEEGPHQIYYEVVEVEIADDQLTNYEEAKTAVKRAREDAKTQAKKAFVLGAQELFDKHRQLESFSFTCYTNYWNDGDPCYYSARADEPDINGNCYEEWDGDWAETAARDIAAFVDSFESEDHMAMFGDHVRVTVYKNLTINTEDYSDHG